MDVFEADKIKKYTEQRLSKVYFEEGIDALYDSIQDMYDVCKKQKYDVDMRNQIKGECTEIYLQAALRELQKKYPGKSLSVKGLCISKAGTDKTTEIDVIFFCEHRIYLFECKCYAGVKTLSDIGYLKSKIPKTKYEREIDVYSQSRMHCDYLNSHIGQFHLGRANKGNPAYKLVMVDGSDGELKDVREDKYKDQFPVVRLDDLIDWLDEEMQSIQMLPKQWNIDTMKTIIGDLYSKSSSMLKKHLSSGGTKNVNFNK